ncbi:hypothetical protein KAK06_21815 [Ideonella sp. 4Y11]|uniref:Uncharacterized protein n=1 Tax=Ideonella aquatica TaxID=2824119 RepID=A0A940YN10_9BURK|nr:hypothetical protein [Ideonella aquatica]MBQ0961592.1 hypothetical protein [Ideonella aquatica]
MTRFLIVLLVALGAALASNPGADAHRAKLKAEIAERSQIAGVLGLGGLAALVSTYHTLGVASYTTINDRVVSYGAFGLVVIPELNSGR